MTPGAAVDARWNERATVAGIDRNVCLAVSEAPTADEGIQIGRAGLLLADVRQEKARPSRLGHIKGFVKILALEIRRNSTASDLFDFGVPPTKGCTKVRASKA